MIKSPEVAKSEQFRQRQRHRLSKANTRLARSIWGSLSLAAGRHLRKLTESHCLSIEAGDLQFLDGKWYVTHAGLLGIARRRRCAGIRTDLLKDYSDPSQNRWVFKATIYKSASSRGFVGYGDADPASPKREPSTVLCAKPMASASVPSRSWVRSRTEPNPPPIPHPQLALPLRAGPATASPGSGINCAF
jgi:hypothetical protein